MLVLTFLLLLFGAGLFAQTDPHAGHDMSQHQGHDMSQMQHTAMTMSPVEMLLMNFASGTSQNPASWEMPMVMKTYGPWRAMYMSEWFLVDTQQTGPRGGDKLYSPNATMLSVMRPLGSGTIMFQTMLSLEPATITNRSYPLLFQTGETAYGRPLVDAQHPHDFVMALSVTYARPLGENTTIYAYLAPVGDPALGPVAYPHRASAQEIPQAPIGHHWQDSTHIVNEVVTLGVAHKKVRLEASGFHGREPGELRWNIDYGPIDSWSARLWVFPAANWAAQVSVGRLHHPEENEPVDITRTTASVAYTRGAWSSSLIWGHSRTHSFTGETVARFQEKNIITARVESAGKDELFPHLDDSRPADVYRIGAYTFGYTRDIGTVHHVQSGLGANFSAYTLPAAIQPVYGGHPVGVNVFLRFRLR